MANKKKPAAGSRGARMDEIQEALGSISAAEFAKALADKALDLHLPIDDKGEWNEGRVSRLRLGRQPMTLDDAAAVLYLDPHPSAPRWDWLVFGDDAAGGALAVDGGGDGGGEAAPLVAPGMPIGPRTSALRQVQIRVANEWPGASIRERTKLQNELDVAVEAFIGTSGAPVSSAPFKLVFRYLAFGADAFPEAVRADVVKAKRKRRL